MYIMYTYIEFIWIRWMYCLCYTTFGNEIHKTVTINQFKRRIVNREANPFYPNNVYYHSYAQKQISYQSLSEPNRFHN